MGDHGIELHFKIAIAAIRPNLLLVLLPGDVPVKNLVI